MSDHNLPPMSRPSVIETAISEALATPNDNQPPVEAIQGEARAREHVALAIEQLERGHAEFALNILRRLDLDDDVERMAKEIWSAKGGYMEPCRDEARAMLAFQSEARAVPSGGEPRDMPADDEIRLLREALTIYGDRVRMARSARPDLQQVIDYAFEHTPNRPAWGGDSETRHLPHQADREAIARIIDPEEWALDDLAKAKGLRSLFIEESLAQADAILALSPTPSAGRDGWQTVDMDPATALPYDAAT